MEVKVSELIGRSLDYAVAHIEGVMFPRSIPKYSTNWLKGGPIIDREGINIFKHNKVDPKEPDKWCAHKVVPRPNLEGSTNMVAIAPDGPKPLIAAMRCYVASKLGETVEIPKELL